MLRLTQSSLRDFVNTAQHSPDREDLTTPTALANWLHDRGLITRRRAATPDGLDLALRLREGHASGAARARRPGLCRVPARRRDRRAFR